MCETYNKSYIIWNDSTVPTCKTNNEYVPFDSHWITVSYNVLTYYQNQIKIGYITSWLLVFHDSGCFFLSQCLVLATNFIVKLNLVFILFLVYLLYYVFLFFHQFLHWQILQPCHVYRGVLASISYVVYVPFRHCFLTLTYNNFHNHLGMCFGYIHVTFLRSSRCFSKN